MMLSKSYKILIVPLFIISILGLANSCGPGKTFLAGATSYEDQDQFYQPSYRVFHINDSISRVYFIIPQGDILYVRNPKTLLFEAKAELIFKIFAPENKKNQLTESGLVSLDKIENKIPKEPLLGYFDVKLKSGKYYYLSLTVNDLKRKQKFDEILTVDKTDVLGSDNFIITDSAGKIKFKNFIASGQKIKIRSEVNAQDSFFVTRFNLINSFPPPIYIESEIDKIVYERDSVWKIKAGELLSFYKEGIYRVSKDSSATKGLTILNIYEGFPLITKTQNLAPPMRFITSDEEFEKLLEDPEKSKLEAEKLWASMAEDMPKTEKLLNSYYKRVEYANIYFTSYKEGWRTDRGLVYIIFGPPGDVYKNPSEERWTYGMENSYLKFEFNFKKVANPLTDNDYILERESESKNIWQAAVESWRDGKVFDEVKIIQLQEEANRQNRYRNNFWSPYYGTY